MSDNWWGLPLDDNWICTKCGLSRHASLWREVEPECEDCGSHDGRECPECGAWFDHVWGSTALYDEYMKTVPEIQGPVKPESDTGKQNVRLVSESGFPSGQPR